jgi:hypothetical protein
MHELRILLSQTPERSVAREVLERTLPVIEARIEQVERRPE